MADQTLWVGFANNTTDLQPATGEPEPHLCCSRVRRGNRDHPAKPRHGGDWRR